MLSVVEEGHSCLILQRWLGCGGHFWLHSQWTRIWVSTARRAAHLHFLAWDSLFQYYIRLRGGERESESAP